MKGEPRHGYRPPPTPCIKRAYKTKKAAKQALVKWRACGGDGALQAYACSFCPRYHLGHPTAVDMLRKRKVLA